MGNVIYMLGKRIIEGEPSAWADRLDIEDCEDIHLHYRNRRLEFSDEEFFMFADCVSRAADELRDRRERKEEREMLLASCKVNKTCKYYPSKFTMEANEDGCYHFHYRDLRVDFNSNEEFERFSSTSVEAYMNYIDHRLDKETRICIKIPLVLIQPFDAAHRLPHIGEVGEDVKYGFYAEPSNLHNERIDEVMQAIKDGKTIRPIAAKFSPTMLVRKDGFCRYWAHKMLGLKYIECIIGRHTIPGVQDKKSFIIDEVEHQRLLAGEGY